MAKRDGEDVHLLPEAESKQRRLVAIMDRLETMLENITGEDTEGRLYNSIREMWDYELEHKGTAAIQQQTLGRSHLANNWLTKGGEYWESEDNCPTTVDGVLGGYGFISNIDIDGSRQFIASIRRLKPLLGCRRAADCGAGIGRISHGVLLKEFSSVDLVEQSQRLLGYAPEYIGSQSRDRIRLLNIPLQDFYPEPHQYDIIWIQWVLGHLNDEEVISFLYRCKEGLAEHGMICVKENCINTEDAFIVDKADQSITRSEDYLKALFQIADMRIIIVELQGGFPDEIYPVRTFALEPR